jgi:hypothetical protein
MFPLLLTALRSAGIRYGDLALRALTLETRQLPDRLFAPVPAASPPDALPPACESRVRDPQLPEVRLRDAHVLETRVREARSRLAGRPQAVRPPIVQPLTVAARGGAASCRPGVAPSSLHRNAARRGVAAADGRLTGPGSPAGRRRP